MAEHIHPIFDQLLQREEREERLQQRSKVLWLTGLSGSGKSTVAKYLERLLFTEGYLPQVLDGDNIRFGINSNLSFSPEDRLENIRRIAEISKLYLHSGIICINSFISPSREMRDLARSIVGAEDFIEIYINAPIEVCEARDVKGLYQKARAGLIKGFTGIDDPYEAPENPNIEIRTDQMTIEASAMRIMEHLRPLISLG
ncbi:adenylyl-sulfate kinase [Haliscomenobacter hydrossis]|uniref:Adenylyl-sulfate kinase n=1 Tax=Haliscomenobacter hydrossis (strain ATCC 27775 / DSM 1100 / LMG 10767 / O) TaxID=760192 RepID=F4L5G8_HALH1|nr:adenylyl-sulfate kinase [Haliscomenobacter hydrossis]AEE50832.1 Adenylyl-sulfate kinase [Haliscomenobacter hydrossis DSM 1100]